MAINEISWNPEAEGAKELSESSALADFKDLNSLAKAFVDTKAMVGQSIRIPSEEAGAEDVKKFQESLMEKVPGLIMKPDADDDDGVKNILKSLGMPEEADQYGEVDIAGTLLSEEDVNEMKAYALEAGLTKRQFNAYTNKIIAKSKAENEDYDIKQSQDVDNLKREWGEAYELRTSQAARVAEASGAPEEFVEAIKLGTAPTSSVKWMYDLARRIGGEDFQAAMQEPSGGGITPDEARERAQEIRNQLDDSSIHGARRDELIKRMIDYDAKARVAA